MSDTVTAQQLEAMIKAAGYELDTSSQKWPCPMSEGDYHWRGYWLIVSGPRGRQMFHWSYSSIDQLRVALKWVLGELQVVERTCAAAGHKYRSWSEFPRPCPVCEAEAYDAALKERYGG